MEIPMRSKQLKHQNKRSGEFLSNFEDNFLQEKIPARSQ